jgi:REP element-mobilizing transposase RayT
MARALRLEYAGAVYHVMARGNQQQPVFRDERDRRLWLETLAEACQKTGWRVHAYVLMGDHYHLLLETPEPNLSRGMKWLQSTYTSRFNRRHQLFGHLFQGRYKAVVVDGADPSYFQVVSTYIHLNPARAGLIRSGWERLKSYRWSSYPWYLSRRGPEWLSRERVLGSVGLKAGQGRGYEAYVESRVLELGIKARHKELEKEWKELRRGWYLGGERFRDHLADLAGKAMAGKKRASHSGPARQAHDEQAAAKWLRLGLAALDLRPADLGGMLKGAPEKAVLAAWLRQRTTASLGWIAERLDMGHESRVSQAVGRMRHRPGRKFKQLQRKLVAVATGEMDE